MVDREELPFDVDGWLADVDRVLAVDGLPVFERFNRMYLNRLEGQRVTLVLPRIGEIGVVERGESFLFSRHAIMSQGGCLRRPFRTASGGRGQWEWFTDTRVFVLTALDDLVGLAKGESLRFSVQEVCPLTVTRRDARQLETILTLGLGVEGVPFPSMIDLSRVEDVFTRALGSGRRYEGEKLTLKAVSRLTGVPASTLSNIKNKKASVLNLPAATLLPLSTLGQLKRYDDQLAQAWRTRPVEVSSARYVVSVTTTIGVYTYAQRTSFDAELLHRELVTLLDDETRVLTLRSVTREDGVFVERVTFDKRDVERVEMVLSEVSA